MENYMDFESFSEAVNNAAFRKVAEDGSIRLQGRRYESASLLSYTGQYVHAFVDLDGAEAICFTPFDRRHICNAKNPDLWEELRRA